MSRERELLKRVLKHFNETLRPLDKAILTDSIRDFLSTPETEQDEEPVARLHITETDTYPVIDVEVLNGEMLQPSMSPINVYTIQQKPFVRLSEEPVAYIRKDQLEKASRSAMLCEVSPEPRQDRVGLFLHPAPRKPFVRLSEVEIVMLAKRYDVWTHVIRAIEDALEEKNRG